jgi:hypothetical protein
VFDADDMPWDAKNPLPEVVRQRVVDTSWGDAVWAARSRVETVRSVDVWLDGIMLEQA